jgi:NAD(P)-dependent dehydrogenase (short-subunit alcohol dehydrogenase family)
MRVNVPAALAVVTGGSRGIGKAIVARLLESGARVVVLDADPASVEGAVVMKCDVAQESGVVTAAAEIHRKFGTVTHAFLNAGVASLSPFLEGSASEWDRIYDVNVRGVWLCLRELGRFMVQQGTGGSFVITGSISGVLADSLMAAYNSSKAAVSALARVAAVELGRHRIRVNVVAPGTTETPLFSGTDAVRGYRESLIERTPLGRIGAPDDIADAAVALSQLEWVTGQTLIVDGGISLTSPIDIGPFLQSASASA